MDCIRSLGSWNTNKEVIRLDITIDQRFVVNCLDTCNLEKEYTWSITITYCI